MDIPYLYRYQVLFKLGREQLSQEDGQSGTKLAADAAVPPHIRFPRLEEQKATHNLVCSRAAE